MSDTALHALIALLLPAFSFLVLAIVFPLRRLGRPAAWFSILCAAGAFWAAVIAWNHGGPDASRAVWPWLPSGGKTIADVGVLVDPTSTIMLCLVSLVALLVQFYSLGYLHDEPPAALGRYYAYQSLFAFSMMGLVLAPNLLQLFMCWELVGLCSYLLIGFWYQRPSAARAAVKAFWITKAGDVGLLIGIVMLLASHGDVRFDRAPLACRVQRDSRRRSLDHHLLHLPGCDGQVGPVPVPCVVARRDGRADAGLRLDPRRDDGDRGRVPAGEDRLAVRADAGRAADRRLDRRVHGAAGRRTCLRAGRHQARARVLDGLAAWLHDDRHRRGRRIRRASCTCSRTGSSRRCSSSAPAP